VIKSTTIRKLKTSWLQAGDINAKDILFIIHGFPDDPQVYQEMIEYFAADFLVIAPFLRGVGESEADPDRYRIESSCLDFLGVLKSIPDFHLKNLSILGHDLGGALAYGLASLCPKQLKALIVVNSLSLHHMRKRLISSPKQMFMSRYMVGFINPTTRSAINPTKLLKTASAISGRPSHLKNVPESTAKARVEHGILHYKGFLESKWPVSPKIRSGVLHIHAKDDPFLYPPTEDEIKDLCPHLEIRVLEGSHWILQDKPSECFPLIEDFICRQH
jgi:epoxide hydrolase 4